MKALVVGALGVMGEHIINKLKASDNEPCALVDIRYANDAKNNEYQKIADVKEKCDVIIDFSFHGVVSEVLEYAEKTNTPAIIATTGHTDEEKEMIKNASQNVAIFYTGNMSVGIATLCDAVKRVVSAFPDADVEIIETHHTRKLDAPSGTAKMIFDAVKEIRPDAVANYGRNGLCKREKNEIGINSLRIGNIVGIHEIRIGTDTEQITLKHEAYDRALFADGAVKAAQFMVGKGAGLYTMKELLKD
ncbi:MAG: 4-hydroxy-tetrahydrodipicolinate reductase [Clostridia bacterium]|nr:4-hydroxy-tetrahydrodipicolinate reductase [Clostridia bacterium]